MKNLLRRNILKQHTQWFSCKVALSHFNKIRTHRNKADWNLIHTTQPTTKVVYYQGDTQVTNVNQLVTIVTHSIVPSTSYFIWREMCGWPTLHSQPDSVYGCSKGSRGCMNTFIIRTKRTVKFSSVQFSWRWYLCAQKNPYALHHVF